MTTAMDSQVLADWYREQVEDEIRRTVPKAVEYGAGDLAEIGRSMARMADRGITWGAETEQDATEIGILFYLIGKLARWEQAVKEGRRVSDDTLFDIRVYAGMAIRNRQVGGWPWSTEDAVKDEPVVAEHRHHEVHALQTQVGFCFACTVCGPLNGGAAYPLDVRADQVIEAHEQEYNHPHDHAPLYTGRTM